MFSIAVRVGLAVILLHFSYAHNYGSDSDYASDADYSNGVGLDSIAARFDEGGNRVQSDGIGPHEEQEMFEQGTFSNSDVQKDDAVLMGKGTTSKPTTKGTTSKPTTKGTTFKPTTKGTTSKPTTN